MVSDKYKQRREESLSKSREKSFDVYAKDKESVPPSALSTKRNGYHARVENPKDHTFLSRIGETNREAKQIIDRLKTEEKSGLYFNNN